MAFRAMERLYAAVQTNTYALEISAASEPPELMATLKARGFFRIKQTALLHRRVEVIAPPACALRIMRAAPAQAAEFIDLCVKVVGLDEPIRSLLASTFAGSSVGQWRISGGCSYAAADAANRHLPALQWNRAADRTLLARSVPADRDAIQNQTQRVMRCSIRPM